MGSYSEASAAERADQFDIVANLQNPGYEPGSVAFRSVVLRFPWVYAFGVGSSVRSGKLYIFRVPQKVVEETGHVDQTPKLRPLRVIENVGDGKRMVRWDDLLMCTRGGGLELFSVDNPQEPKSVGQCMTRSRKRYLTTAIVRDRSLAYVIGNSVILCYDLSDRWKPRCIGETATEYRGRAGCISDGFLYVGGSKETDPEKREGIAVFDSTHPSTLRELAFVPVSRAIYHIFITPRNQLLASLDGDSLTYSYSPPSRYPYGKAALFDITKPTRPCLVKELKYSGSRVATMFSRSGASYFVCEAAVFLVRGQDLEKVYSFWDCGSTFSGFPYSGDSDATYVALPNDEGIVLLKYKGADATR
jgi:hypothetical protein